MKKSTDQRATQELYTQLAEAYARLVQQEVQVPQHYAKGESIFREGETPQGVYFIQAGWVKVYTLDENGNEAVLRLASKNEFIGYVSLLKQWRFHASAVAITKAEVHFIPKRVFLELLQSDVKFANLVVQMLCDELTQSEQQIGDLLFKNVRQRLATFLLGLEQASGFDTQHDDYRIRLPKKEIARVLGISPETLSRHLSKLTDKGLISLAKNYIKLLDKKRLLRISKLKD